MKLIFKKVLDIPTPLVLTSSIAFVAIMALKIQGDLNILNAALIMIIGIIAGLQFHLGSVVLRSTISIIIIMYSISLYTYFTANIHGYVTEPFLLSLSSVTIFLAQSYSFKQGFALRSKALWSAVLSIILIMIKLSALFSGFSFKLTELMGLIILVIYIICWRLWIHKSKKTKIIKPIISKEEIQDNFSIVYINNKLDDINSIWIGEQFNENNNNASPYIYNKVLQSHEKNLILVLISEVDTNEIYDIGQIKINKSKILPYLYMEAKDKKYCKAIISKFVDEITRYNN